MVFSYDVNQPPAGDASWQRFLEAVESSHLHDEDEWLEFKGPLDLDGRPDRAKLAKAIVAFANRDPRLAQTRFRGQAFVVVGLEPGKVTGFTSTDPAQLHDRVDVYLSKPTPHWESISLDYRGTPVLVVRIGPPQEGDPIHHIAKTCGEVVEGQIYVRRQGKSERAGSADLQRLMARLNANTKPSLDIEVTATPTEGDAFDRVTWQPGWSEAWAEAEREYLLGPMLKDLHPPPDPRDPYRALTGIRLGADHAKLLFQDPEPRSEEQYRTAVEEYLGRCRKPLAHAPWRAAANHLPRMRWVATNRTPHNLTALQVVLTFPEGVSVTPGRDDPFSVRHGLPKHPRRWGPIDKHRMGPLLHDVDQTWLHPEPEVELFQRLVLPPIDLRANDEFTVLDDGHVLLVARDHTAPVTVHWSATATNVSGRVEGDRLLELGESEDLTPALSHVVGDDVIVFRGGEMLRGDEL